MMKPFSLLLLVQEHGEEAAGGGLGGPFEVNPGLIIWTWVVFIALFFLLRKYAFPAIVRLTEERERRIAEQLADAEEKNKQAQSALEEHRKLVAGAKQEAQDLISDAKQMAQKEREQLLTQTRDEQQQMLDRAKREIDAERERAVQSLRKEAVDIALAAAAKLIQERLDQAADRKIVERYLSALDTEGK